MSIASLMEEMAAKGASLDVILMAVRAIEAEQGRAAAQREKVAERKRRQRAKERDCHGTVTGQSCDTAETAPSLDKEAPQTPKEIKPIPGVYPAHARETDPEVPAVARLAGAQIAIAVVIGGLARRRWRDMPPPAGVTAAQWAGFLEHRKAKRQTLTHRAYELLCTKLTKFAEDGWPPGELIDDAVDRGWLTVFPPRTNPNGQRHHNDRNGQGGRASPHPGGRDCAAADIVFGSMEGRG